MTEARVETASGALSVPLPAGVAPATLAAELAAGLPERDGEELSALRARRGMAAGVRSAGDGRARHRRAARRSGRRHAPSNLVGRPGPVLSDAIDRLLRDTDQVFGWFAFEFGTYRFGLQGRLAPRTPLARLFLPRTRIVIRDDAVRVFDAEERHHAALLRLLSDGVAGTPVAAR